MKALALVAFASAWVSAGPALARKAAPPVEPPMQVYVVRSGHAGCEPQCLQWIAAQGRIVAGSLGRFKKVLRQLGERKLPVFIDSSGGSVNDALAIGRLIRAKGLDVAVTRTVFTPCAPRDAACRKARTGGELRGLAQAHLSKCASSCAFILAGGVRRFVGRGTGVGVHKISMVLRRYRIERRQSFGARVRSRKTLVSEQKVGDRHVQVRNTYGRIKRYLAEMDIGEDAMTLILSTPNDKIRWLTPAELSSTRLATHVLNGEQLAAGVSTPTSATPGIPSPALPRAVPEIPGYQHLCHKYGACEQAASPNDLKLDMPAILPSFVIPSPAEAAK